MSSLVSLCFGSPSLAKGMGWSSLFHVGVGALLLAGLSSPLRTIDPVRFGGEREAIQLESSLAQSPAEETELEQLDSQVIILPAEARIDERHFVQVATASVPPPAVEIQATEVVPEPAAIPRPSDSLSVEPRSAPPVSPPRAKAGLASIPRAFGTDESTRPRLNHGRPPVYPAEARNEGISGEVLLRVFVDAAGQVSAVEVARSSGHLVLDAAAVNAVSTWWGEPATRDGQPVATVELLPVQFRLR